MPKKKFIDKKTAVSFHLVHRSQRDPLQANEEANQRVLLEAVTDPEKRKEQQREFGVYYDDDYNYLQHLKDVNEINDVSCSNEPVERFHIEPNVKLDQKKNLTLPSTVFGSKMEIEVGMLNKAAPSRGPKLDWDPDIVAALDDDFNYEDSDNILDDDFMSVANAGVISGNIDEGEDIHKKRKGGFFPCEEGEELSDDECEEEDDEWEGDIASDEAEEDSSVLGSLDDGYSFTDEETKSRFTQYSVSSSVVPRNKNLRLLDERFEKFIEQYDDEKIGALDHEDIGGPLSLSSEYFMASLKKDLEWVQDPPQKYVAVRPENVRIDHESDENMVVLEVKPKEKYNCVSIISTYSNLYNHPTLIPVEGKKKKNKIRVDERSGLPVNENDGPGLSLKDVRKETDAKNRQDKACTYRPRNETAEEKKVRKGAVKEERKARRQERKATKIAFRKEAIKYNKERINAARNEGVKML